MFRLRFAATLASLLVLLTPVPSRAVFHLVEIHEVLTSLGGDATQQFIEMRMLDVSQQAVFNSVLAAFDASGNYVGDILVIPGNVTNSALGVRWLVATTAFQTAASVTADFTMPAGILPVAGGMVCFGGGGGIAPAPPGSWSRTVFTNYIDCVSYGAYTGPANLHTSAPTPLTGEGHSLQRLQDTNSSAADFACADPLTPENNGGTLVMVAATTACPTTTTSTTATTTTSTTTTLPQSKCASKKILLATKKALGELQCRSKEIKKGIVPAGDCTMVPSEKFSAGWAKAQAGDDCLTSGDESTIEGKVDAFFADVESDLVTGPGPSSCTSKKLKLTGKKAFARSKCDAKAVAKGEAARPECIAKAADKFSSAWAKAEAPGNDCQTSLDGVAMELKADTFEDDIVTDLVP